MTGICPHCKHRVPMDADHPNRIGPHSFGGELCLGISREPVDGSVCLSLTPAWSPADEAKWTSAPDLASLLSTLREAGTAEDVDDYEPQRLIQDAADAIDRLASELAKEKDRVAAYAEAASRVLDTIVGTTAWADAIRMLDAAHAKEKPL